MSDKSLIDRLESLEMIAVAERHTTASETLKEARLEILKLMVTVKALDQLLFDEKNKSAAACDLVESCIDFSAQQLKSLPSHLHCDSVLQNNAADLTYFIEKTQGMLEELRGNQ